MSTTDAHTFRLERERPFAHESPTLPVADSQATAGRSQAINVGAVERLASLAVGATLTAYGLVRAQRGRLPLAGLGALLVGRGVSGRCQLYRALGVDTTELFGLAGKPTGETVIPAGHGCKVEKSVTINRSAADLYAFWHNLENLPRVMRHLKSVKAVDGTRSHWVAEGPLGRAIEWDAEIFNDRANEAIAWRSLPGGDVATAGSVHFKELGHKRGTVVAVSMKYDPPVGKLGAWAATLLGDDPARSIADDLRNLKRVMEAGEIPSTKGQPSGRRD